MPGQLYKLDSKYGSAEELKQLLAKLREAGIDPLCDVVINHRCVFRGVCVGVWHGPGMGARGVP
jgi:alpha-amylase